MPKKASLTCFFIGPMKTETGELERLKRLGETLLAPTLRPLGYDIVFPDDKRGSADIVDFIMKSLDTADLVVADLTDGNPNVYYEVAIRHSLGLPYALLSQHVPRFDLSHLQCHIYRDVEPQSEDDRAQLKHYLEARHKDVVSKGDVVNPISRFYGVPLAEVSPASGLSLGYYNNFIVQTMRDIRTRAKGIKVADQPVPEHDRKHIRLQIWIPDQLTAAQHQNIPYHLERNDIKLLSAVIDKEPRPFSTYALPTPKPITLIDVPTALSAIEVAISSRYSGMRLDRQSDEWKALEAQEIERFTDNLVRLHRNETDQELADKVSIHRWNTATGAVKLRKVPRVARVPIA